ncbi:MAG: trigger factor [Thermoleophilia bacterium]|nr:trigger factor [Thermoleophilia bacterium]
MKTTLTERDGNTVKMAVEVSTEELRQAFDGQLKKLSREVRIAGFRPGKAPVSMVRQRLGDEAILIEAVEESMNEWFSTAAVELDLEPVDRPEIEPDDELPELGKPFGFKATVTVMPEIVLGAYKGVEAAKEATEAEDSEVDGQMERLQNEFAELRPVSGRAVQMGDFVNTDLRAVYEGQPVEGLEATDYVFELGGNQMFAEVEAQVVGMNIDEERTFAFALPEGFPDDLGGKTVDFTIVLKDIKEKVLPALTDQWASEVSEFATLLELRQEIRSRISLSKAHSSDQLFRARAIKAAADNATVDLPDVVVRRQAETMMGDFKRSVESQGGTLEGYVEASGVTVEQIIEDMKPAAANNVKTELVLDAVAKAEGIEATDEEVSAMVAEMAAAGKVDAQQLEKRLRKGGRLEELRASMVRDKAADLIVEQAVAVAPAEPAAEPAPEAEPASEAEPADAPEAAASKPVGEAGDEEA